MNKQSSSNYFSFQKQKDNNTLIKGFVLNIKDSKFDDLDKLSIQIKSVIKYLIIRYEIKAFNCVLELGIVNDDFCKVQIKIKVLFYCNKNQ